MAQLFVHVPIPAVVGRHKRLDPHGGVWIAVQEATGQPFRFGAGAAPPARHDQIDHGEAIP